MNSVIGQNTFETITTWIYTHSTLSTNMAITELLTVKRRIMACICARIANVRLIVNTQAFTDVSCVIM